MKHRLKLKTGSKDVLRNRESTLLEFKNSFSVGSLGLYTRTVCAFANNNGGYIVFGVSNRPHRLEGVDERIDNVDLARIADHFQQHLAPEVKWTLDAFEIHGVRLGFLAVERATDRPVMAIRDSGKALRRNTIYYRYHAQSSPIRYSELQAIIEQRLARERSEWMRHLQRINDAGPSNVGILDTSTGRLHGFGATFIVDEDLIKKVRFVNSGRFSESEGEPTLRLIGDVQTTSGTILERPVEVGIHADNIVTAFLSARSLGQTEARNYLREVLHQTSPLIPFLFLLPLAGLDRPGARKLLQEEEGSHRGVKERVLARLAGEKIGSFGGEPKALEEPLPEDAASLRTKLKSEAQPLVQRSILYKALLKNPGYLTDIVPDIPITRLSEAVSHLAPKDLLAKREQILAVLKEAYTTRMKDLPSPQQSFLRRAIAFADQELYDLK